MVSKQLGWIVDCVDMVIVDWIVFWIAVGSFCSKLKG